MMHLARENRGDAWILRPSHFDVKFHAKRKFHFKRKFAQILQTSVEG